MTRPSIHSLTLGTCLLACGVACRTSAPAPEGKPEQEATERHEATPERVTLTPAAISEAGIATWEVKPVDLEHLLVLNGSVGADENHLLQAASNVRGRVAAIPVDLGAWVRKGDALLVLESVELGKAREEFIRETATLRVATRSYERAKTLVAAKAISSGEFQSREGEYLSRKAAAEAASRTLGLLGDSDEEIHRLRAAAETDGAAQTPGAPQLTLRAPFDGRVVERKVTPGALVEALQPLLVVANLRKVWVFLQAYEKDVALIHGGLAVTIRSEAYPQASFRGRVDFVGSMVDAASRTLKVRATVANPGERLKPGMFVKAHVDVPRPEEETRGVPVVPQSALQTLEGRVSLFVQTAPGVFERRFVETGHTFEGFTEVLGGAKVGDLVVTEGSFVVKSEFAKAALVEED